MKEKDIKRFWAKVDKSGDCWLWTAGKVTRGYGAFHIKDKQIRAHRASMIIEHGGIPDGKWVLHKCNVRACVRPDHLYFGTPQDNSNDMKKAGTVVGYKKGEAHPNTTFTADIVKYIRDEHSKGRTQLSLAAELKVSQPTIYKIVHNITWNS